MRRRTFIKTSGIASLAAAAPISGFSNNSPNVPKELFQQVKFTRDGLDFTTQEYSHLLNKMANSKGIKSDSYSRNGIVKDLEKKMAKVLGKESAVFMPTGTLANNIAVKKLAGPDDRVIVQAESHLYNDSGDGAQKLNNINLIPLAPGKASFTLEEVKEVLARAEAGRVKTGVGVISIESPIRRVDNQLFDFESMQAIGKYAKEKGIRLHLDGARMFNACVHEGKSPAEYAAIFDTVYVSMYKDFNAASGAILAGSHEFCKDLYHIRRMFGGGMPQVWPFAAVAYQYVDSFLDDYTETVKQADELFELLGENQAFRVEKIPNGSNVLKLFVDVDDRAKFRQNLRERNIIIPKQDHSFKGFKIKINPSLLRSKPIKLAEAFMASLT